MDMIVKQVTLSDSLDPALHMEYVSYLVCWLEALPTIKIGTLLTLKETGDKMWRVEWVSKSSQEATNLPRGWHVGGL
jgi:hypothetical protein